MSALAPMVNVSLLSAKPEAVELSRLLAVAVWFNRTGVEAAGTGENTVASAKAYPQVLLFISVKSEVFAVSVGIKKF